MGQQTGDPSGKKSFCGRRVWQSVVICSILSLALSCIRLVLHCTRAVIPGACAFGTLLQLLEWRSQPPAATAKCRLIALAGVWGIAALCDCTAASDYWLTPGFQADPFQSVSLPLACSSVAVSAVAVLLTSCLSRTVVSSFKEMEAEEPNDEKAPLAAPHVPDAHELLSNTIADDPTFSAQGNLGAGQKAGGPRDGETVQLQPSCLCLRCCNCRADTRGAKMGELPTVTTLSTGGSADLPGRHYGSSAIEAAGGLASKKRSSKPDEKNVSDKECRQPESRFAKHSAFFPSQVRDGGLLGFASFDGGRAALRGPPAVALQDSWPCISRNDFRSSNLKCTAAECATHLPKWCCEERSRDAFQSVSSSVSTTASQEHITSHLEDTGSEKEDTDSWYQCFSGSSPLLSEFLEDSDLGLRDPQSGKHVSATTASRCGAAREGHSNAECPTPGSLPAGSYGNEAGWKPYLMMLGFQGSGGCKRDGSRTKRIKDLKWLDVMVVDAEEEHFGGFGGCSGSRMCDV